MFAYPFCVLCTHLRTIVVLWASHVDICAPRGVFTLMAANWPLMSVNVFFVGYGGPCPLMVWAQRSCGNGR